jgi:AbrB family looped-hinge helix DNA binding protein
METVTLSPKYQVVIPQSIRDRLGLEPGEKMQVLEYQDRIEFIPRRRLKEMRGFLKGLATTVPREGDRP